MNKQIKREMAEVISSALREWARGTRGASLLGAGAMVTSQEDEVTVIGAGTEFKIRVRS